MHRASTKVCGKLISRTWALGDATQIQARYLCKANESQQTRESRVNLKIHENAISNHYEKNVKRDNWLTISKTIIIFFNVW